ncbi:CopG family antitoxin, partial [Alishewanella jeotgali]
ERKNALMQLAANNIEQDRKISVRISVRDLEVIQRRALEQGLPYQSLVSSILHKYVSGAFKEVER